MFSSLNNSADKSQAQGNQDDNSLINEQSSYLRDKSDAIQSTLLVPKNIDVLKFDCLQNSSFMNQDNYHFNPINTPRSRHLLSGQNNEQDLFDQFLNENENLYSEDAQANSLASCGNNNNASNQQQRYNNQDSFQGNQQYIEDMHAYDPENLQSMEIVHEFHNEKYYEQNNTQNNQYFQDGNYKQNQNSSNAYLGQSSVNISNQGYQRNYYQEENKQQYNYHQNLYQDDCDQMEMELGSNNNSNGYNDNMQQDYNTYHNQYENNDYSKQNNFSQILKNTQQKCIQDVSNKQFYKQINMKRNSENKLVQDQATNNLQNPKYYQKQKKQQIQKICSNELEMEENSSQSPMPTYQSPKQQPQSIALEKKYSQNYDLANYQQSQFNPTQQNYVQQDYDNNYNRTSTQNQDNIPHYEQENPEEMYQQRANTSSIAQFNNNQELNSSESESSSENSPKNNNENPQQQAQPQFIGCNCKKSRCLKLYCECFANQGFCIDGCNCQDCRNKPQYEQEKQKAIIEALQRNPDAFLPKSQQRKNDENKKGCSCKKTKCIKKYCECYNSGMPCSGNCSCINCENTIHHIEKRRKQKFQEKLEEQRILLEQQKLQQEEDQINQNIQYLQQKQFQQQQQVTMPNHNSILVPLQQQNYSFPSKQQYSQAEKVKQQLAQQSKHHNPQSDNKTHDQSDFIESSDSCIEDSESSHYNDSSDNSNIVVQNERQDKLRSATVQYSKKRDVFQNKIMD